MAKPTAVKYNTKQGVRWKGKYHCIDDRCRSRIKHGHCRGHTDGLSGFKTKGEAVAAATRRQSEVQSTGLTTVDKKKVTLDDVAREYFDSDPTSRTQPSTGIGRSTTRRSPRALAIFPW